jgi:hypothetical protein
MDGGVEIFNEDCKFVISIILGRCIYIEELLWCEANMLFSRLHIECIAKVL